MKKLIVIALSSVLITNVFATDKVKKEELNKSAKVEMTSMNGIVLDEISSEPIAGAEIKIEGNKSIYTDINGNYSIEIPQGDYTLNISFISYKDKKVNVSTTSLKPMNIKLIEE